MKLGGTSPKPSVVVQRHAREHGTDKTDRWQRARSGGYQRRPRAQAGDAAVAKDEERGGEADQRPHGVSESPAMVIAEFLHAALQAAAPTRRPTR